MSKPVVLNKVRQLAFGSAVLLLSACIGSENGRIIGSDVPITAPALEMLSLDFERTNFDRGSRVSGAVARKQRDLLISTATTGLFRKNAMGPIPAEVRVDIDRLSTSGNTVRMSGRLAIRDLVFGTVMAEIPDFRASGSMPVAAPGSGVEGLVFRGVEDEVLAWLSGLECNSATRICAKPAPKPVVEVEETTDEAAEGETLELASMVGARPRGLSKINSAGISAEKIIEAAPAAEPVKVEVGNQPQLVGTTVAALGLLDRAGFWLQTPLVSEESVGFVQRVGSKKRISVTLVPKDGPAGGGSQISLAALNELGAAMTDLVSLQVYK